jgi:hypothetical protein
MADFVKIEDLHVGDGVANLSGVTHDPEVPLGAALSGLRSVVLARESVRVTPVVLNGLPFFGARPPRPAPKNGRRRQRAAPATKVATGTPRSRAAVMNAGRSAARGEG